MNKNIINNAQLLEIKTKIRQLGAMMNAYQCRFVVSSGQLFFVDDDDECTTMVLSQASNRNRKRKEIN